MKIPFDSLTLMAAAEEMRRALARGRIQRVTQPGELELLLTVRSGGANHLLTISADALFARAHLTYARRPNPPEPAAFCMICRKYLEGGIITAVEQRGFDRILDLSVETAGQQLTLTAELMGKHSNVILISESGMVLDAIKRISPKKSRFRAIHPGSSYIQPPAPRGSQSPFEATTSDLDELQRMSDPEALAARLMGRFGGLSPFLADELALRGGQVSLNQAWAEIFTAASGSLWTPVLVRGEDSRSIGAYPFPTVQAPAADQHERTSMNIALDHHYGSALSGAERDAAVSGLSGEIERARAAREKKRDSLLRSLEEAGRAEESRRLGELLLANLHRIEPSSDSVTVEDHYALGSPPRTIPIDASRSPHENAENYFRKYRKSRDGAALHRDFLKRTEEDLRLLDAAMHSLQAAVDTDQIKELRRELASAGLLRSEEERAGRDPRRKDFGGKRIRAVSTPEGWEVLVGENSEANDYLTTRVAGPNDLWLHVRATPSAHVVIRTRNEPFRVPQSVIKRAAILAAQHSPAKHSETVPVDYTLKKHVRRPRGAAPGAVLYQHEKTIHVSPRDR